MALLTSGFPFFNSVQIVSHPRLETRILMFPWDQLFNSRLMVPGLWLGGILGLFPWWVGAWALVVGVSMLLSLVTYARAVDRVFGLPLVGAFAMVVCGFDWFVGWCLLACNVLYLYRADAPILSFRGGADGNGWPR